MGQEIMQMIIKNHDHDGVCSSKVNAHLLIFPDDIIDDLILYG